MTPTDIVAFASLAIAVFAFFATSWQAWIAYKHNRISVRPLLVWHVSKFNTKDSTGISFSVRNLGLGPAIIRDRYLVKDGNRFVPADQKSDEVPAFVDHVFGKKVNYQLKEFGLPGKGAAIASQGEVVVASLEFLQVLAPVLTGIIESAGDVAFHIHYESMYGEKYELKAT
jgi:hypothetical protein